MQTLLGHVLNAKIAIHETLYGLVLIAIEKLTFLELYLERRHTA